MRARGEVGAARDGRGRLGDSRAPSLLIVGDATIARAENVSDDDAQEARRGRRGVAVDVPGGTPSAGGRRDFRLGAPERGTNTTLGDETRQARG